MSRSIKVNYDNYIPEEEDDQKSIATKETLLTLVLFLLSGSPNAFNLQDALWCELAWFENSQPEGVKLASWLLIMQAVGAITFLCLLYIETHVIIFPKIGILYCSSFGTVLMTIVLSFTWHFSVDGLSLFLLLAAFVGQMTGNVQMVFVVPWIAKNYNPRIISVFIGGNGLMLFLLVILEMIQEPGGEQNFSPMVYYSLAGIVYAITFGVCVYTFNSGIGRLTSKDAVQALEPWRSSLWAQTFPSMFWDTKLLTFGRIWVNQVSWSVIPVALPYAAENTSNSNDGDNFLQWAIALGYLMLLVGCVTSYIPTGKYWIRESIALNTMANVTILIAAGNIGEWSSWAMKVVLITAVGVSRFSFGWVIPLFLRELTRRFPEKKELLVRSNSLWSLYANFIVRLTSGVISSDFR